MARTADVDRHPEAAAWFEARRHREARAKRASKDDAALLTMTAALEGWRPHAGRRPPISGLPEIGTIVRKSATADLRWLPRIKSGVASTSEPAPDLIRG